LGKIVDVQFGGAKKRVRICLLVAANMTDITSVICAEDSRRERERAEMFTQTDDPAREIPYLLGQFFALRCEY